ncbi:MAG TPA: type I phosphomannose isomerase catalytic subunit [Gammaproteobacteria bacterium]
MPITRSEAQALLEGDHSAAERLARTLLKPLNSNFVERPWGGTRLRAYKGLPEPVPAGAPIGEAFEIAACDEDDEARRYPSRVRFGDGSEATLPELLARHAETLLGETLGRRFGACFPLLPKTLDVAELLSVQAHPQGNPEVYVIIDADPGATIRLGFAVDIDPEPFKRKLHAGRREQRELLEVLGAGADANALQALLKPWLAARSARVSELEPALRGAFPAAVPRWGTVAALLESLKALYWEVLDSMNVVEVEPGQVIHNANPARIVAATGLLPSAEVHALGNPEGREILALEIRRPGPTLRAWDNVRFPVRDVDVDAAVAALNLSRTSAEEYLVEARPVTGRPGVFLSVESPFFRIEHLRPLPGRPLDVPAEAAHCLHAISGRASLTAERGEPLGELGRGESALVPAKVGAYRVIGEAPGTEIVKVSLPDGG